MEIELKGHQFVGSDQIRILPFLNLFCVVCDSTCVHGEAAMSIISNILRGTARDNLKLQTETDAHHTSDNSSNLTIYSMFIDYLLHMYASNDILAAAESDISSCRQGTTKSATKYDSNLDYKYFGCDNVFSIERFISIFSEGMNYHRRHAMRLYHIS